MLPSPTKFHYTFTLRDLSRLFQGVLRTPKSSFAADHVLVQLWRHEAERVFADKLTSDADKGWYARRAAAVVDEAYLAEKEGRPPQPMGWKTTRYEVA